MKLTSQPTQLYSIIVLLFIFGFKSIKVNAQGPNAPEAASFEPVDATDMVNLVTGDLSYVLPLLNVPSPEGGYPLALSYHAGIPLDLEASWVGLGWNLNPGAINRNVNGLPDDWGTSLSNEFFYDVGGTEDYYDFGVGANIYGINVGVGAYWGSNKSFGGSVSFGIGAFSANIEAGTRGVGVGGQVGLLSANISTNGIGMGVGLNNAYGGGGINFNYGFNSSISSSASLRSGAIGISLHSNHGISGTIGGLGAGLNHTSSTVSSGDYAVNIDTKGVDLDLMLFRIRASRTRVKYDLYKETEDVVTGALYPFESLRDQFGNFIYNRDMPGNMDVFSNIVYDETVSPIALINQNEQAELTHLLYPAFDNYVLTAQGISGTIRPQFNELVRLSTLEKNGINDVNKVFKLNGSVNDDNISNQQNLNINLNNGLHFYFNNTQTSFLRTNISSFSFGGGGTVENVFNNSQAIQSTTFNSILTPNGEEIKNSIGIKRDGQVIETFTNNDVITSNTNGWFIEAKNIDRNNNLFPANGIGGFRVTALDGKVYHYSLPVYNFELYYKNFLEETNEDENFFLNSKEEQYATHWLLTAITGPDYVDSNSDGELDESDFGYWVEFEYGKWTDGFIWKGATGDYDIVKGNGTNPDNYEYYRGRKQIYYLDAIKTRTHTAYFVKSTRQDSKGEEYQYYDSKITSSNYNILNHTKNFYGNKKGFIPLTYSEDLPTEINNPNNSGGTGNIYHHHGFYSRFFYADFPKHEVLKLDKIILVSNDVLQTNNIEINKSAGQPLSNLSTAYFYNNGSVRIDYSSYGSIGMNSCNPGNSSVCSSTIYDGEVFYKVNDFTLKEIDIHISDNVLDSNDIINSEIELYAQKIIEFGYDNNYKLASNSYNSDAPSQGKLTLNSVLNKGKGGTHILPPYTFNYNLSSHVFNENKEDAWGYDMENPDAWSLNEIKTPIGGKILIEYESDDFYREAIHSKRILNNGLSFHLYSTGDYLFAYITLNDHINASNIDDFQDFRDYFEINGLSNLDLFICRKSKYGGIRRQVTLEIGKKNFEVIGVSENHVALRILNDSNYWYTDDQDPNWILNRVWSLTDVTFPNGVSDGVIIRDTPDNTCAVWRESYNNDDVSINFQISTSRVPYNKVEGGIRTKSIQTVDEYSSFQTKYYYNLKNYDTNPNSHNYRSSGITSYSPSKEAKSIPYVAELPQPTVMYKNVIVENSNTITSYEFETMEPYEYSVAYLYSLGNSFKVTKDIETLSEGLPLDKSKYTIHNKLNNLGRLKTKEVFNLRNQLLSKDTYNYKSYLDNHGESGVYEESYMSKSVNSSGYGTPSYYFINVSSRINYPSVLESIKVNNGVYSSTSSFTKNDFLTGQVLETITEDSKGNRFKTELVPAYTIAEYGTGSYSMGSKVDDITNKNMLLQEAMTKTYIEVAGQWKETGVGITTWNNNWLYVNNNGTVSNATLANEKIWRKHKNFVWDGSTNADGTFEGFTGIDDNFNWGVSAAGFETVQSNPHWKNISTTTQYDRYSMPEEVRDLNGNYASTKMDKNHEKVFSTSNAAYSEQFFSGAEEKSNGWVGGQINIWNYVDTFAHTGSYSEAATVGSKNFKCFPTPKLHASQTNGENYHISVWVHRTNGTLNDVYSNARVFNGSALEPFNGETVYAGDWVQLNHYLDLSVETEIYVTSASGTLYFDDFRLHPTNSSMTSYVYNEWDELSYILGSNNFATHFKYDESGRLIETYNEVADFNGAGTGGIKLVKDYNYNYALNYAQGAELSAYIDWTNPMNPLETGNYLYNELVVSNGSGDYSYSWEFKKGSTVLSSGSSNFAILYVGLNESGNTVLNYTVVDNITGITRNVSKTFFAFTNNSIGINFSNIQENVVTPYEVKTTASISVPRTDNLKFWAMNRSVIGADATITITRGSTTLYTNTFGYYQSATIEVPVNSGDNLVVTISIPLTSEPPPYVVEFRLLDSVNGEMYPINPQEIYIDYQN
jgi:hypothetical protein